MKKKLLLFGICILFAAELAHAAFTEPTMADYTAVPTNLIQSVPPNIMVILDNSGSMNFNAYGTYPGDYKTVSDAPFTGEPYSGLNVFKITSGQDDAEEGTAVGEVTYYNHNDLDLGGFNTGSNDSIVGLRFQNITVPQGAVIRNAYIVFRSNALNSEPTNILIEGEASDNALPFDTVADNIKNRTATTAAVTWNDVPEWSAGVDYPTADFTEIVQEIVNRPGWVAGNAMAFRFKGIPGTDNKRDPRSYEANASTAPRLHIVFGDDPSVTRYYGYFNPDYFYTYNSGVFNMAYKKLNYDYSGKAWNVQDLTGAGTSLDDSAIVSKKLWDGNWLNWLCMRRVDVLRKVLMGGFATSRTGGGNQVNKGEIPKQTSRVFYKNFNSSIGSAVSPYDGNYTYRMEGGYIYIGAAKFQIWVKKDSTREPEDFVDGNLAGVLQKVGDKARWGNMWFNAGTGKNQSGGIVEHTIGTNMTTLITDLQNTQCDTSTPLAETYYVAMQYFKQQDPAAGLDFTDTMVPNSNIGDDPYYDGKQYVPCAKSFVILLTDGASTTDSKIPGEYKDYDNDNKDWVNCTETSCNYPGGGSDYLDDLALYARTVDLRSSSVGKSELDGDQNLILYAIHAFDKDPNATSLLRDAARNGGFEDRNGNKKPDGDYNSPADERLEWDKDGDGQPDTFFEASDGYELEARLLAAITDILKRASSGTTASVLATNNMGAGHSVQSYYRPMVTSGLAEARWLGYMQSLWVDPWGNLREDSNGNLKLDLRSSGNQNAADANVDKIVEMVNGGSDLVVRRYLSHYLYNSQNGNSGECRVDVCTTVDEEVSTEALLPLFEAGKRLSQKTPDSRTIFTYVGDGTAAVSSSDDSFDNVGDVIVFDTGTGDKINPFLGVTNSTRWGNDGAKLGGTHDDRVTNIIDWVRGTDVPGLRNRTLENVTWRLGDIVNSTPIVVGPASENYHVIYDDQDYVAFIKYAKERETVVYVGANDGMMHAFTHYVSKMDGNENIYYEPLPSTSDPVGEELWAYIPQSVLPHLKWTASVDYTHTYYVNSEPRVFDAKILPDDMYYSDGDTNPNYGTFMVFGLNMGGKNISVYEDFGSGTPTERQFAPTYVMMDITDPRKPRLVWERSYSGLGMSCSVPAPVRVGSLDGNDSKWFLVFGSGPSDYDYVSDQPGRIFVVDMLTGEPYGMSPTEDWRWQTANNSYFNAPLALDVHQSNNVDGVYLAENYFKTQWLSDLHKIVIPCTQCLWSEKADGSTYQRDELKYDADPYNWMLTKLFEPQGPVSAKLNAAVDFSGNVMLFFGTGRFYAEADKIDVQQQYLYAIKDPFYNETKYKSDYYHKFGAYKTLLHSELLNSGTITVTEDGTVSGYTGQTDFWDFVRAVRADEDGWYVPLLLNGTSPSERIISQTAVFGGLYLTPTFTPQSDICSMGGETTFLAGYFETGTAYKKPCLTTATGNPSAPIPIRMPTSFVGMPPSKLVIHTGQEKGTVVTIQLGTGEFLSIGGETAFSPQDAIMDQFDDPSVKRPRNLECTWENDLEPPSPSAATP